MFKNGIEMTPSKSVKSKKRIEVNITVNQNTENERKCKLKREKKKTKKSEVEKIPLEANDVEVCRKLKKMKKKKISRRSSISDEEQGAKIERKIAKGHPQESEIDEDSYHLKNKKKRKKSFKINEHSGPQSTPEKGKRNISEDDPSRVQVKSEHNNKKKKKINFENSDVEEGFTKSRKTSNGTADKLGNITEVSCVVRAKSVKRKKKKKHFHSEDFDMSGNEKSMKKWQRDINISELEAGNDKSNQADTKKQKDEQILDTLEKKCMKKKKKHKLHTVEREEVHKGEMVKKRQGVEQIENNVEYVSKSHRKRKRSAETEGEGIETNLDKTNNICKFQDSPETAEGKKVETPFDVLEESVKIKMKIKRTKKEASSVMQIKEELCNSDDLQFMSERKGNLFEVTIDKDLGVTR
ncbi:uncharacterized protein DDB_G0283697-like [Rhincodon typus]|uniref:uncharacterized protein DDB_G0283697-like n=1 Tax=Rhincodon typus TaxID=259920 RepID=UPI00202EDE0C|nr:uncharacterized protein DDB_G0283697-like [Rhincodon typus]